MKENSETLVIQAKRVITGKYQTLKRQLKGIILKQWQFE